jgi:hypothetical protein
MISAKLIDLIEIHASHLTSDVAQDLVTNEHTRSFRAVPLEELKARTFAVVHHLGDWIGAPKDDLVRAEFEDWGHRRYKQGIPLSEVVYAMILLKRHLRRYIHDHGLVDTSFPRIDGDYVLPMHLHSLQELNAMVGEFFDKATYFLARGYEAEAAKVGR